MSYTIEKVEALAPAIWDTDMVLSGFREVSRDPEMPGSQVDPREGSTILAECADVQRAWRLAPLTDRQRQVMYLRFGWGDLIQDIGHTLGVDKSNVSRALDRGLVALAAFLNGGELEEVA